jgi:hypothetical protein
MLAMMTRPLMSLRRRRLLGHSQKAVCEGGGEHLADLLRTGIVDANDRPAIAARDWVRRQDPRNLRTAKHCLAHRPKHSHRISPVLFGVDESAMIQP